MRKETATVSALETITERYPRIIIISAILILYISVIGMGFVYFDDDILILGNYEKLSDITNLGLAFRTDAFFANMSPYYRPMMNVSFMIDALIGGKSPVIYHMTNLALHILTCLALYSMLLLLGFRKSLSLAATILFSVHPVMGHAVMWIPARGDLMLTLFTICGIITLVRIQQRGNPAGFILHALCYFGAIFSKETGIILPFLFLLFLFLQKDRIPKARLLILSLIYLAITAVWYFLRHATIDNRADSQRGVEALIKNAPFIPEALSRFFFPFNLPVTPVFSPAITLAGVVIGSLLILTIIYRWKSLNIRIILFGLAWFFSFCLPNMYVRLTSSDDSFEYLLHRIYLPSIGLITLLLVLIPASWLHLHRKKLLYSGGLILLAFFGYSFMQQQKYRTATAFWDSSIAYAPERSWFYFLKGRYYFKTNDLDTYEKYLQKAAGMKNYTVYYYQLGMIYYSHRKDYDKAYDYFTNALKNGHEEPEALQNFVLFCIESSNEYFKQGQLDKAIGRCEEALEYEPKNGVVLYNLGIYLINKGEKQKAAGMWKSAVNNKPDLMDAYRSLALYYHYDAKKPDSARFFASLYKKYGGNEIQFTP